MLAFAPLFVSSIGHAWLFPEHRAIAVEAIQELDPTQRAELDKLWSEARSGHAQRLCAQPAEATLPPEPTCVDYAAWPAVGGDHSCSPREMLHTVLESPWILDVEKVSAKLEAELATAQRRDQRVNAIRDSNLELQRADPDLATRATSNIAHFSIALPTPDIKPDAYANLALGAGARLNALGTYAWYHLRALAKAAQIARGDVAPDARAPAILAAFGDEAFADHFLEDAFAAGHFVGSWGDTADRLGTHDYYNEHGIKAVPWRGSSYVALGDGYMRPEDQRRAAAAVRDSLRQLLEAFSGEVPRDAIDISAIERAPDAFNVCKETRFPEATGSTKATVDLIVPIIAQTPVPALGEGKGELPRFHAELGPFVGVSAAVAVEGLKNGFGVNENAAGAIASLEVAVRGGFGLEGVMSEAGDGLVFAEVGFRQDSASSVSESSALGNLGAVVPSRSAFTVRLRCPFWLIPGDLALAAPVLAFTSPKTLGKMAVEAANGGLIPWQAGIATPIGRFQFVLGREIGISFYGYKANDVFILPTPGVPPSDATTVDLRSIKWEFPIVEYRPFRSYSTDQSSSVLVQLYFGVDVPTGSTVTAPVGAPKPELQNIWLGGLRVVFDWRHYFRY
jgi:hypothetical protein